MLEDKLLWRQVVPQRLAVEGARKVIANQQQLGLECGCGRSLLLHLEQSLGVGGCGSRLGCGGSHLGCGDGLLLHLEQPLGEGGGCGRGSHLGCGGGLLLHLEQPCGKLLGKLHWEPTPGSPTGRQLEVRAFYCIESASGLSKSSRESGSSAVHPV